MAKPQRAYVCQTCGTAHSKWGGKCEGCGAWNTLVEEISSAPVPGGLKTALKGRTLECVPLSGTSDMPERRKSGLGEFDRVTGGGLVMGSALLIGGDPGIGKSTLLLQVTAAVATTGARVLYVSGEEAVDQVRLRALRLGLGTAPVILAAATNVRDILSTLDDTPCDVLVIDSIQTMYLDSIDSAPGTVAQVRASALELIRAAKKAGTVLLLVGHVTKEGQIAGPRVMEHMVDTVLYFEGERGHAFRILRAVKNRFGATDEIGVFEMAEQGLIEVPNPSEIFLAERQDNVSGSAVFAGLEGTRPLLVEIQALVAPSTLGTPRRAVIGWDAGRLSMVLAVLEARCGVAIGNNDVYLNIAGGLKITEPGADLAVATALVSALTNMPVPEDMIVFGEVGLSGEVRPVGHMDQRLKEAERLGFKQALMPSPRAGRSKLATGLKTVELKFLSDLLPLFETETKRY